MALRCINIRSKHSRHMANMRRHAKTCEDMQRHRRRIDSWCVLSACDAPRPSCCADLVPLLDVASPQANTSRMPRERHLNHGLSHQTALVAKLLAILLFHRSFPSPVSARPQPENTNDSCTCCSPGQASMIYFPPASLIFPGC